jgi:(p)ppGpp synthase/HD superfamily hydrolase
MNNQLPNAIELATKYHEGQTRRDGSPYITHPAKVASMLSTEEEKAVAWLHDVVEDTEATLLTLQGKVSNTVIIAVEAITERDGEPYEDYIIRVGRNSIASRVKIADMFHNISDMSTETAKKKYFKSLKYLLTKLQEN